jgi:hypothetical protein
MKNFTAITIATIAFTFSTVCLWSVAVSAAEPKAKGHSVRHASLLPSGKAQAALQYHPLGAAKGNPPSAARAQMARYNVPGGCVISTEIRKIDGAVIRHSRCEYTPAQRVRLATTGK